MHKRLDDFLSFANISGCGCTHGDNLLPWIKKTLNKFAPRPDWIMNPSAPLIFGEVLVDCFPDGNVVPGGAPFNVAWNLQALGLPPCLISRVGADDRGEMLTLMMARWGMETAGVQIDPHLPTGEVTVTLDAGEPRFTIRDSQAYDRIAFSPPPELTHPVVLYHGTLALRGKAGQETLARLKQHLPCPVFVDVNLRAPWWERETVLPLLEDATWLKLNEGELRALFPHRGSLEQCGGMLLERFNLDGVFITLGARGALALTGAGERCAVSPPSSLKVVDAVGAGDAFASVLLLGLTQHWPLPTMMERARDFAAAVVGQSGAVSTERNFYQSFKETWL